MRENRKFGISVIGVLFLLICFWGIITWGEKDTKRVEQNEKKVSIKVENEKEEGKRIIKQTSAGFYLYDKNNKPILNSDSVKPKKEGMFEFNIECVNTCDVDLMYYIVVLVNDCYQDIHMSIDEKSIVKSRRLKSNDSEVVNVKFEVDSYVKDKENELRIVMFYFPNNMPQENLDQVLVGDSVGVYRIENFTLYKQKTENHISDGKFYFTDEMQDTQAVWLTESVCKTIPKFNFILNVKKEKYIYFSGEGKSKKYVGIILVDGVPIKIKKDYVFCWNQKGSYLFSFKIKSSKINGKTMFAYMYESGSDSNENYITDLYKVN